MSYRIFFLNVQLDPANIPATVKKFIQFHVLHENLKSFYILYCMQEQACLIEVFPKTRLYPP